MNHNPKCHRTTIYDSLSNPVLTLTTQPQMEIYPVFKTVPSICPREGGTVTAV